MRPIEGVVGSMYRIARALLVAVVAGCASTNAVPGGSAAGAGGGSASSGAAGSADVPRCSPPTNDWNVVATHPEWLIRSALDVGADGTVKMLRTIDVDWQNSNYADEVRLSVRAPGGDEDDQHVTDRDGGIGEFQTLAIASMADGTSWIAVGRYQNVQAEAHIELWQQLADGTLVASDMALPGFGGRHSLAVDGDGAVWLAVADPTKTRITLLRRDAGAPMWVEDRTFELSATGSISGFDLVRGAGRELWFGVQSLATLSVGHRAADGAWTDPEMIVDDLVGMASVAASPLGDVALVYSQVETPSTQQLLVRMRESGVWSAAESVGEALETGGLAGDELDLAATVDLDGRPWVAFIGGADAGQPQLVLAHREGASWMSDALFPGDPTNGVAPSLVLDQHGAGWLLARNGAAAELRTRCIGAE